MPLPLFLGLAAVGAKAIKAQMEKSRVLDAAIEKEEERCAEEAKKTGLNGH